MASTSAAPDSEGVHRSGSGWAPLRFPAFRRLWLAQFTSNVGSWMQTVAAQWVMTSLTSSALLLSAISAAGEHSGAAARRPGRHARRSGRPPAADPRPRRSLMLLAAAALAVLAALGGSRRGVLLGLLFVIGIGGAASAPTWQTLQPELVPPADRPQAIALGSVNQNLARAVGPAIGGRAAGGDERRARLLRQRGVVPRGARRRSW